MSKVQGWFRKVQLRALKLGLLGAALWKDLSASLCWRLVAIHFSDGREFGCCDLGGLESVHF
jgi:hypothetical protein